MVRLPQPQIAAHPPFVALHERIERVILELRRLDAPLIVACSGGIDSSALLLLVARAQVPAIVVHIHHHLRADAHQDQQHVEGQAQKLGLPCWTVHIAPNDTSKENVSQQLRQKRYDALTEIATHTNGHVLTAHHCNDLLETFIQRVQRGTGLHQAFGLQPTMAWKDTPVHRPLLHLWKDELRALLEACDFPWIEDSSNATMRYARNALRPALAPLLEALDHSPRFADTLAALAAEAQHSQQQPALELDALIRPIHPNLWELPNTALVREHIGHAARLQDALYRFCRHQGLRPRRAALAFVAQAFWEQRCVRRDEHRHHFELNADALHLVRHSNDSIPDAPPIEPSPPVLLPRGVWTTVGEHVLLYEGSADGPPVWARPWRQGDKMRSPHSQRFVSLRKRLTKDGVSIAARNSAVVLLVQKSPPQITLDFEGRPVECTDTHIEHALRHDAIAVPDAQHHADVGGASTTRESLPDTLPQLEVIGAITTVTTTVEIPLYPNQTLRFQRRKKGVTLE